MRRFIVVFTLLIVLLSLAASLAGVLSYGHDRYRTVTTPRGDAVQIQETGVYRHSARALVVSGTPWDFVRLLVGIPVLMVAFVLHLRGSLRGTVLFIGSLSSFLYQYLLWTFDWAYNSFFIVYVAIFGLSLWTLIFVLRGIDQAQVRAAIGERFPRIAAASFSFAVGAVLLLKCLGEIVPGISSGSMPAAMAGYYTMVDQALDLGLLVPFCIAVGVLLLKRETLGYLLSGTSLILVLSVGLPVVAGELMLGLSTGRMNVGGITVFSVLLTVALVLLVFVLTAIKGMRSIPE